MNERPDFERPGMTFSVLIPCHNVAPWIGACLDSVRGQTCAAWECVVVDDGSTDGSGAIVAQAAAADGRFQLLRQANAGVGAARNAALAAARGDWIVFLDGDDTLAPEALSRIAEAAAAHPDAQAIRFGYVRTGETGDAPSRDAAARVATVTVADLAQEVPMTALRSYLWQFAFRRAAIEGLRFSRYRRGEDRLFLVEALLTRVNRYAELDASLYRYRRRDGSAMQAPAERQVLRDELDHRLAVVRLVAASGRRVDFSEPAWYEWIEDFYLNHWRQLRSVRADWQACLRALKDLPGFTRWGRLRLRLAVRCPWALRFLTQLGRRHG